MSALHLLFRFVCHQLPGRSPAFGEVVFPICFRCAGLYSGLLCGYLFLALRGGVRRAFPELRPALFAAGLTAGFLLDGWANALHLWESPAWLRTATGFAAGIAVPVLLLPLCSNAGPSRLASLNRPLDLAGPMAAGAGLIWMLTHPASVMELEFLAIACATGLICVAMNLALAFARYHHE